MHSSNKRESALIAINNLLCRNSTRQIDSDGRLKLHSPLLGEVDCYLDGYLIVTEPLNGLPIGWATSAVYYGFLTDLD